MTADNAPAAPPATDDVPTGTGIRSIQIEIGERLSNMAPDVRERVITTFVAREQKRQSEAIVAVMEALRKLRNDDRKIKPDLVAYNLDKSVASENWSQANLKKKEDSSNRIKKHETALNKALDKADFGDVYKLAGGGNSSSDEPAETDDAA